jgi:Sensors of blue-light using FAD
VSAVFRIVYVSSASKYFDISEIETMLDLAREKNVRIGITGMLLYKDGNFLQCLEGEEAIVAKLANTIQNDPRHTGFLVLMRGPADRRLFPNTPMGFHDLGADPPTNHPGYSDFIDSPLARSTFALDPSRCLNLLSVFSPKP